MRSSFVALKKRHRAERDGYSEQLSLRVHRALSWLNRAEQCDDDDGRFIFLWIAFNAAYANDLGQHRIAETSQFRRFLTKLVQLDADARLYDLVWSHYTNAIRVLLDNHYVFQPYWDCQSGLPGSEDWQAQFQQAKIQANLALAEKQTDKVLAVIFTRLYTLRNQLVHGAATWNGKVNRDQLRDGARIMADVVPSVIEIMMDHPNTLWGDAAYPVVS